MNATTTTTIWELRLNRHFVLFSKTSVSSVRLANFCLWCATQLRKLSAHLQCDNRLCWWHEQKHAWPLQEAWITRKRREKRKMESNWISCLSLLYFYLFLSSLSYMSTFFFTYTREGAAIVFLCMFAYRKQETFLLTYDFTRSYITQVLEYFLSGPSCMQWPTLLSASLRRLFRKLWRIVIRPDNLVPALKRAWSFVWKRV